ncbi:hypothetical protein PTI98_012516 [Pleurotus ostreatus]|nr:hypothetical protein PTI98_012516 [Pleurotus ostreatus]
MIPRGKRYLWPSFLSLLLLNIAELSTASPASIESQAGVKSQWSRCSFVSKLKVTRSRVGPGPSNQIPHDMSVVNLCPLIDLGAPTQVAHRLAAGSGDEISRNHKDSGHIRYVFDFGSSVVEESEECGRALECLIAGPHNVSVADSETGIVWTSSLDELSTPSPTRAQAKIHFKCNRSLTEISFRSEEQQGDVSVHSFDWETPHACEHVINSSANLDQIGTLEEGGTDESNQEDQDGGSEDEEQNLVPPAHTSHRQILRILFFAGLTIVAISALVIRRPSILPTPLRSLLMIPLPNSPLLRFAAKRRARSAGDNHADQLPDHRFRVDEGRLVRWAHEDMSLEGEGELDVMVNGSDDLADPDEGARYAYGYGYGAAGVGRMGAEYIPLKPNPFAGTKFGKAKLWGAKAGYGSVVIGR